MHNSRFLPGGRGYSLIELMVVVGIMGILSVLMATFYNHYEKRDDYNQRRIEMLNQLQTFQDYIKRDIGQLDLQNQLIVLTDQTGKPCTSLCPNLRFRIAKTGVKVAEVSYASVCVDDSSGASVSHDLSQATTTCLRCAKGKHVAISAVSGGKSFLYDVSRTTTGKQDRYSAGSSVCSSLGADGLLIRLAMGLVDETGNVKALEKELYFPLKRAENLQILGR